LNVSELRVVLARLLGDEPELDADVRIGPGWLGEPALVAAGHAELAQDGSLLGCRVYPHGGGLLAAP
jgi:hypothetical protein